MLLVNGVTGNVGGEVARSLVERGEHVRGLVREETTAVPDGVEPVVGDLDDADSLREALDGVRGVFLLSGYTDMPGLLAVLRESGVRHVVLLSSGAVAGGEVTNALTRMNLVSEAALIDSGIGWTILRPSGFMSNTRQWADQLASGDVVEEPFASVPVAVIDPADIGAVAAEVLTGSGHEGRIHRLTGPEALRPADRLRILGEVLNRDLHLRPLSDDEARDRLPRSMPGPMAESFLRYFADGTYDDSRVLPTVREVLHRDPRTFADWAQAHREEFEG